MVYAEKSKYKQRMFLSKLKIKFFKKIAKSFPLNKIRVFALKRCGYELGEKVYIGEDLIVASMISEKSCFLKIGNRVAIGPRVTILLSSDANWSKLMLHIEPVKSLSLIHI